MMGELACVGEGCVQELSVPSSSFCCEPKSQTVNSLWTTCSILSSFILVPSTEGPINVPT